MSARLKHIGTLIKDLREERGFSQAAFARKLRTSQSAIARIENGEQNLSTATLSKISSALDRDILRLSDRSLDVRIEGRRKLRGTVVTRTSKNGAVALLSASLLNRGKTLLKNMPHIEEVHRVIEVLQSIGVAVRWLGNDVEIIPPKKLSLSTTIPRF